MEQFPKRLKLCVVYIWRFPYFKEDRRGLENLARVHPFHRVPRSTREMAASKGKEKVDTEQLTQEGGRAIQSGKRKEKGRLDINYPFPLLVFACKVVSPFFRSSPMKCHQFPPFSTQTRIKRGAYIDRPPPLPPQSPFSSHSFLPRSQPGPTDPLAGRIGQEGSKVEEDLCMKGVLGPARPARQSWPESPNPHPESTEQTGRMPFQSARFESYRGWGSLANLELERVQR